MPKEFSELATKRPALNECPLCGCKNTTFMRGEVQRSKRYLWFLWERPYCAVICNGCKEVVGWEDLDGNFEEK